MYRIKNQKKAIGLIEVVIVIAIIGIIAVISWYSLSQASKQTVVENACNTTASMINKARNYALTGKKSLCECTSPPCVNNCDTIPGVPGTFSVTLENSNIQINGIWGWWEATKLIERKDLDSDIEFSNAPLSGTYGVPNGNYGNLFNIVFKTPVRIQLVSNNSIYKEMEVNDAGIATCK